MALLLALDFGGTKHTVGVIDRATALASMHGAHHPGPETWLAHERVFSPPGADAAYDLETVQVLAPRLLAGTRPAAIGVSFGGPVAFETGTVRLSHHVPGWENVALADLVHEQFGAAVAVDNDANVAALGEYRYGAGRGTDHIFYVTVSTGVGGGWILNGEPWRGAQGMAGEIGHTVVDPAGPRCLCGKRGCVERLASGPYLAADAREALAADPAQGPILRSLAGGDLEAITGKLVSEAAERGDPLALQLVQRSGRALGVGLGNAANLMNPERIVLGGGVTKAGAQWWEAVRQAVAETTLPEVAVDVVPAALGDDAPLWGAVALAVGLSAEAGA